MPNWTKEQTEAINKTGQNIIVSAGAGSGKTAVLSERVITKLKQGISLDTLLILTFTNAAAAEMKQRIKNKIIKENLQSELPKVDIADITTFDAYALSLVKKYSHLLNISPDISIVSESIIKLQKKHILDKIFDKYYQEENKDFLNLIEKFTLKDDQTIKNNIMHLNSSLDNLYNKKEFLENYLNQYYSVEKINYYLEEYYKLINEKKHEIKELIHSLSFYTEENYINKLTTSLNMILTSEKYDDIKINFPDRLPSLPKNSEEEAKQIKKQLTSTIKELQKLFCYQDEESIKKSLYQTKDYVGIIVKIILKLDEEVLKFKNEKNTFEFTDISRMAINLLKENKSIANSLKEKYSEILIDEYQDTNDIQEKFISYIEKNNIYMVGDIKQSIYRFRHTNPLLFKNKYENYSKNIGGIKIDLNKNFRSRNEVLDNINKMFNQIMDFDIGGADYQTSHQMIFGNTSYNKINKENYNMEILNYEVDKGSQFSKEEIEIFTIASDIKKKINNYEIMDKETGNKNKLNYKDIAILIDRSSSFELYKKIFEYLNIPITIYRDKAINNSDEIILFKHIYNLILSNKKDEKFKYSFVSLARSYLFEIKDNEIFEIINGNFEDNIICQKCNKLKENIKTKTNEMLLYEIIDTFDIYMKMLKVGNINQRTTVIDSLLKIAKDCDKLAYQPTDFYNYLSEVLETGLDIKLSLNKEESNSVKIMTIHASKGLEFPICYFSGLSKNFNDADLKSLFYFSEKYGINSPYFEETPKTTILKTLLKNNYMQEEISERIRLFYVALTRAREKMILITNMQEELTEKQEGIVLNYTRLKYKSFQDILNSIYKSLEKYIVKIDLTKIDLTKNYNLSKTSNYISKTNKKLDVKEINIEKQIINKSHFSKVTHKLYTKEEKANIELGLRMHSIFENIDFFNPNVSSLNNFEKEKVMAFINSGILKNALEIYKEYEFIYTDEKEYHGIIDLLLIKEKENIIVDYKLKHTEDKEYLKQLQGYKKYIENITNKETKIYLYSILDEKFTKI